MEISSFPFLNQDEISHFYSLFQDMDTSATGTGAFGVNNDLKKRKRKGDEEDGDGNKDPFQQHDKQDDLKKSAMRDILASLLMLDEEEKQEQQQWVIDSQQDRTLFDSNYKRKVEVMNDYSSQLQNHYSDLDEMDHSRTKRARRSASTVAALAIENAASGDSAQVSGSGGAGGSGQHRRLWVKDRSKDWWERCSHPDFPEEEFKKSFRMSKATFAMICDELDSVVTKKNTMLRDAIPVRQRVAVCIWRLATGEPLRLVSKRFGLGISTCHKLVLEVCSAIRNVLMPKFLQWPDEERLRFIRSEYESMSGIPNVGGSMYTTHIPIIAPKISVAAYFNKRHTERNQKTSYSITVQGVVDPRGVFTDVCIGWPGSMPDDQVLEKSALYQRGNRGALKDVWIVGNSGHPLMDWVLVPYTHQNLTWTQHAFNEKIGEVQRVAKEAFARLKGRWSCLQKRTEVKLQDLPVVLGACCVLHNICEMRNEEIEPELKFDIFDDEMIAENGLRSVGAIQARDHIAHNLLHHGLAGTSFL
ncbi:protein ALP1-like [Jatropha curcas]|uniref:protein ALP1-like n=1 Tax=Jatropha curcas TaxID=180498 RepID=UPI0005FB338D|nr:protein ALP1-like [Jatropha curcas]